MDPVVLQHLAAADRNLAIARDLLGHVPGRLDEPAFDWAVIVSFYAAVRSLNAYLRSFGRPDPRSHAARNRELHSDPRLEPIRDFYVELLDWSRDARYTQPHTAFGDARAQIALEDALTIYAHIRREIEVL